MLLVFNLTNRASFEHIPEWYREAVRDHPSVFVPVGHKCDLAAERVVSAEEAGDLAATLGMAFVETSARGNLNVELAFQTLAGDIQRALGQGTHPTLGLWWRQTHPQPERPPAPSAWGGPGVVLVLMGTCGRT